MGPILNDSFHPIALSDLVVEENLEKDEEEYATWIEDGHDFIPAPNLKTIDKLPSGMYRIIWSRDDWRAISVPLNTDELYSFSEDFTSKIISEVTNFWEKSKIYDQYNLSHRRGILLCGGPGCGKTSIIALLVKQLLENDGLVFLVSNTKEFSSLTETLKPIIRKIEKNRPIITIIEDIDQIISEMGGDHQLLDFLDGRNSIDHHLVLLTSNDTTELSDALLRPSRVDLMYEIPSPDDRIRREYFEKKGVSQEQLDTFVKETEDLSFAQLKEIFIGTHVLGKPLEKVVQQIRTPLECKDYLNKTQEMKGLD